MRESIIILAPTSLYTVLLYHDNFASIIKNVSRAWCVVLLPMPHNHTVQHGVGYTVYGYIRV